MEQIAIDGKFDTREQNLFSELFGKDLLKKIKVFLSTLNKNNFSGEINLKIERAKSSLEREIPMSFQTEYEKIRVKVEKHFA